MKFVPIRDFRIKPGEVWKQVASEENIIITSNGRPKALMFKVDEATLEETLSLTRRVKALIALEKTHRLTVSSGLSKMTNHEIEAEIKSARRAI